MTGKRAHHQQQRRPTGSSGGRADREEEAREAQQGISSDGQNRARARRVALDEEQPVRADDVEEAGEESFPASDPPSWAPRVRLGPPWRAQP